MFYSESSRSKVNTQARDVKGQAALKGTITHAHLVSEIPYLFPLSSQGSELVGRWPHVHSLVEQWPPPLLTCSQCAKDLFQQESLLLHRRLETPQLSWSKRHRDTRARFPVVSQRGRWAAWAPRLKLSSPEDCGPSQSGASIGPYRPFRSFSLECKHAYICCSFQV